MCLGERGEWVKKKKKREYPDLRWEETKSMNKKNQEVQRGVLALRWQKRGVK